MTPAEYKSARATLGLSHDDLAAWLGVNRASSYKWESGVNEVPGPVARAVGLALAIETADKDWMSGYDCSDGRVVFYSDIAPLLAVREGE